MATKVERRIRKLKRTKEYRIISIVIIILLAAVIYLFTKDNTTVTYDPIQQNEEGYYYYRHPGSTTDYYYKADNLTGNQLSDKLYDIISTDLQLVTYNEVRYDLTTSDLSLDDKTKMLGAYSGTLITAEWDYGATWSREHIWPQSRLGLEDTVVGTDKSVATDLHNLRAITLSDNSSRSNRYFDEGIGENHTVGTEGYYPGDDQRGDVARILFYMATLYKSTLTLTDDLDLLSLDANETYQTTGAYMGKLSLLLEWNREDPVDAFEQQRNEVIYSYQGNRNPFIDHPEYVHLIWENMTIADLTKPEVTANIDHAILDMRRGSLI